jgi:hypothetical protein
MSAGEALDRVSRTPFGRHQTAIVRIGIAATFLLGLVRDLPNRHQLWGPDAAWSWDMATTHLANRGAFSMLAWSESGWWFELVYLTAMAAAVAMLVGWRTRAASVLFLLCVVSFQNHNPYLTNAGDHLLRLIALYLVLTRCAEVWSLDAVRRRRRPGLLRARADSAAFGLLDRAANLVHAAGVALVVGQICLVYSTAGWYKVQGKLWQDGTAVYYSTHVEWLSAWPELAGFLTASSVIVLFMTYATVMLQVAFPISLINRRVKNVLLCFLVAQHIGIGLLMGLPYFSLTIIAADLIFVPTAAALWAEARAVALASQVRAALRMGGRQVSPVGATNEAG